MPTPVPQVFLRAADAMLCLLHGTSCLDITRLPVGILWVATKHCDNPALFICNWAGYPVSYMHKKQRSNKVQTYSPSHSTRLNLNFDPSPTNLWSLYTFLFAFTSRMATYSVQAGTFVSRINNGTLMGAAEVCRS